MRPLDYWAFKLCDDHLGYVLLFFCPYYNMGAAPSSVTITTIDPVVPPVVPPVSHSASQKNVAVDDGTNVVTFDIDKNTIVLTIGESDTYKLHTAGIRCLSAGT